MDTLKQGLLTVDMVTDEQEMEIQQLTDLCNLYENLHLHFSQHRLGNRLDRIMPNFLYYEDEKLVGYLVPDSFGMEEKELLGMVHPDYRRRGIFTALLEAAKEVCKARFEAFGSAGQASRIRPIPLAQMCELYAAGKLRPVVH